VTLDTEQIIETGRTWRDLPPEPPVGDPLPPVVEPPAQVSVAVDSPSRWSWRHLAAVLLLLIALLLLWLFLPRHEDTTPTTTVPESTEPEPAPSEPQVPPEGTTDEPVADVAAALLPSVVQIESNWGIGSGFVYDEAGLVFTAAHVVTGSQEVEVRLTDGRSVTGTVVARDADQDVAVVAIDAQDVVAAPLAGDRVRIGQTAIAVGSPFGLEQSVTVGVVSGLDRTLELPGQTISGLIQTDAAINVGNSGGPLADASGRVIGINVAIASASGGSDGVGFAVPIEVALGVAKGITPDSPPAAVDGPADPFGLGGDPLGDLFGDFFDPNLGPGDLDQMLELLGDLGFLPDGFQDLIDELGRLGQGLDGRAASTSIFELGDLPADFEATGERLSTTDGVTTQIDTVVGSEGTVTIRATSGVDASQQLAGASGDVVTVRDQLGKLETTQTRVALRWAERGVLFEAFAPSEIGSDAVIDIVESLEVLN
jgi:Trypsin-like peptidase domain